MIRRAWRDTWAFTTQQGLLAGTAAAMLGVAVYWRIEDDVDVLPILVGSLAGVAVLIACWFMLQLFLAPSRIDEDSRKALSDLTEQLAILRAEEAAASRQFGTELRDIRHKIEIVRSTRPSPHYSHGFRLPAARWDQYDEVLAGNPDLYPVVERAYVAAHHVNEALDMRETRASPGQTIAVMPDDSLDAAYDAAGEALDALGEPRGDVWETSAERAKPEVAEDVLREAQPPVRNGVNGGTLAG